LKYDESEIKILTQLAPTT